jgi:arylsulfatase A
MKNYLLTGISLLSVTGFSKTNKPENIKPNVVILFADDMGYGDLNCYGGKSETPNINKLAKESLKFTNFYAAAPNCSPSRAGLLTGISPTKLGIYSYRPTNHTMHLRDEVETVAEILKDENYQTAHFGKWHLGCLPQNEKFNHPQPLDQGFDYSFGTENTSLPSHHNPINFYRNGKKLGKIKGYSCKIVAKDVKRWLEEEHVKDNPFFMYVAFHEPHKKVASPPKLVKKYKGEKRSDAEYLANIENFDLAVGEIINSLKEKNLFDNTILIISSDNGSYRIRSNGKLRAIKSWLYDGGIRVPGIISYPKLVKNGKVINQVAGVVDIVPTIKELLSINYNKKKYDGTSIVPILKGNQLNRDKHLSWCFYRTSPEIAMRVGNYMVMGKDKDLTPRTHSFSKADQNYFDKMEILDFEIYDLNKDISQQKNIANSIPNSNKYKALLKQRLNELKENSYRWDKFPTPNKSKKLKTNWKKYW